MTLSSLMTELSYIKNVFISIDIYAPTNSIYYHNHSLDEYYCTRKSIYDALTDQGKNVYIITNNLDYYNKYGSDICVYIPYFLFDDPTKFNNDFNEINDSVECFNISNEYSMVYHYLTNQTSYLTDLDNIINSNLYNKLCIGNTNNYFLKDESKTAIDQTNIYLNDHLPETKKYTTQKLRVITPNTFLLGMPLDNDDVMRRYTSLDHIPFEKKSLFNESYFYVNASIYTNNKSNYDNLVRNGYLQNLGEFDGFIKFEILKIPAKNLTLYSDILNNKSSEHYDF